MCMPTRHKPFLWPFPKLCLGKRRHINHMRLGKRRHIYQFHFIETNIGATFMSFASYYIWAIHNKYIFNSCMHLKKKDWSQWRLETLLQMSNWKPEMYFFLHMTMSQVVTSTIFVVACLLHTKADIATCIVICSLLFLRFCLHLHLDCGA